MKHSANESSIAARPRLRENTGRFGQTGDGKHEQGQILIMPQGESA